MPSSFKLLVTFLILLTPIVVRASSLHDRGPSFAGNSTIGTTNYPNGGMRRVGSQSTGGDFGVRVMMVDEQRRRIYFGSNDLPFHFSVYDLDTFLRLQTIEVAGGDSIGPRCAVLDKARNVAYVGTYDSPGEVARIDLATGLQTGLLTFDGGFGQAYCAIIDEAGESAYFGTSSGEIIRVRLDPFTIDNDYTSFTNDVAFAAIDEIGDRLYFGGRFTLAELIQFNPVTNQVSDTLAVNSGKGQMGGLVVNAPARRAYIAAGYNVFEVNIDTMTFTRVVALGDLYIVKDGFLNPRRNSVCFNVATYPEQVVEIDLTTFTRTGSVVLDTRDGDVTSMGVDEIGGFAYLGTDTEPGRVIKVDLNNFTHAGMTELEPRCSNITCSVIDPATGNGYFGGLGTSGSTLARLDLDGLEKNGAIRFQFSPPFGCGVVDTVGNNAYFGMMQSPGWVARLDLNSFTVPQTLQFATGESSPSCAVIDSAGGAAFFEVDGYPPRVVKVDLDTFTREGVIELGTEPGTITCGVVDEVRRQALFANLTGRVTKVDLETSAVLASIQLEAGEQDIYSAVFDPIGDAAYFGTRRDPGIVVKVNLETFTRAGSVVAVPNLSTATINVAGRAACFGTNGDPAQIVKVNLDDFQTTHGLTLQANEENLSSSVFNEGNGTAYFAANATSAVVVGVAVSNAGSLHATRMEIQDASVPGGMYFYSHSATGNLLFSIYDDSTPKKLLWQSNPCVNTASNEALFAPISNGTPESLFLPEGTYWLAWQTDSTANVGSYTPGSQGDGFRFDQMFGAPPSTLAANIITPTADRWTQYISLVPDPLIPMILGEQPPSSAGDRNQDSLIDIADLEQRTE